MVLIGSSDCYGATPVSDRPLREEDALHPVSPYARSKAAAEQLGSVAAARGQDVVRVRAFTHIGPGQTPVFVASSFARQIATAVRAGRDPILHVGNLDSVRDFLDVRDVVDAYARLLDPKVAPDVYNVASGRGRPIREVLEGLCAIAGVQPKVEVDADLYRPTESRIGDASRLRGATGWEPRIAFADTLRDLFEWWLERVAS